MNKPIIILVAPQMGENIGAAARAMKNFGLNELRIVSPRDGWPNEKAIAVAVGAADIIHNSKIFHNLKTAVSDLEYVYATTSSKRDMNKPHILSKNLSQDYPFSAKIGIIFGRESSGLSNEEISLSNKIITINTDINFSSLNISQAIVIICYELFNYSTINIENNQELCTKQEMEYFFEHLLKELDKKNFFRTVHQKPQMILNIRNMFTRIDKMSKCELQTLRGIIKSLTNDFL